MRATTVRAVAAAVLAFSSVACRDGGPPPADEEKVDVGTVPQAVEMRLLVARDWTWNEDDTLRVEVANGTTQPVTGAEVRLFVAAPVSVRSDSAAPDSARPRVSSTAEGTEVVFTLGTIGPSQRVEVAQAVRTPPAPRGRPVAGRDTASRFAVRARVTMEGARELAAQVDTIRIRAGSEVVTGGCGGIPDASVSRFGIGPVRLDMRAGDVRTLCPEARDTTWRGAEGTTERGLGVSMAGHPVRLAPEDEAVDRIVVDTAGVRTSAGVGVGSTVADLRQRYGRLCAGIGEGRVALWTPAAPGIGFGLAPGVGTEAGNDVSAQTLPDTASVREMWVRKGEDTCPAAR